ncbi:Mitochondrial ribosomal protein L27 [Trypanosoma cruzi]|nr:Mitochondrial ribosomal protein L27 [Trypanosoma cruzi]
MLRLLPLRLASKVTAGNAKNQAGHPRRKAKLFHVIPGTPVTPMEKLKEQRRRYGQDRHSRLPEYRPGKNVRLDPNTFTLYATTKGVMTIRESRINPGYKWLEVEPDIQKVYRSSQMRRALAARGMTSQMVEKNEHYRSEMDLLLEPHWRQRVMRVPKATERFKDPNLFVRGVITELTPMDRYCYE